MGHTFPSIKGAPPGSVAEGFSDTAHTGPTGTDAQCCGETRIRFCDCGFSSSCCTLAENIEETVLSFPCSELAEELLRFKSKLENRS